ncbi:MAG TPA: SPFH domain-containing protein [Candidatus Baltobacteraceae bacterium]|nr:SPFH domain-containing protein [Candidatus Baltobacteraceae bacterium]
MQWLSPTMLAVYGAVLAFAVLVLPSIRVIGPTEIGLVTKRFSFRDLKGHNPVAMNGEAGHQADLLPAGWKFKLWLLYSVRKFPWVQIPAGEIGVVIAQVGDSLPIGAKSAHYKKEFGSFDDIAGFIAGGGQKGVQRTSLPPGGSYKIHPVGFLVITSQKVYGLPVADEYIELERKHGNLTPAAFGLEPAQLKLVQVGPRRFVENGPIVETIGIVTALEGDPLPSGAIAGRLGGFEDVGQMEQAGKTDADVMEVLLGNKNQQHNNYQDFQAFLDKGGKIGLQTDPLMPGAYALNPFLVRVEFAPMLVVNQGEVAVIKSYVGLPTVDTSGAGFKHGSIVRPGHQGIWQTPLRTGKHALNPRCYASEVVPTAILTLNWATAVSQAHNLDAHLSQIVARSKEGFESKIDLQVQIHVPDTVAPRVISMVGTMKNLVNEVLQAAVGNHFRDTLQGMPAIEFIETRSKVQATATDHIRKELARYEVETLGVYIQDVLPPEHLTEVLKKREIANQEIATYKMQQSSQNERVQMEKAKGEADMQAKLAQSKVAVDIATNNANAKKAEADGESTYITKIGAAEASKIEAMGLAKAKGFEAQKEAVGAQATAVVNAIQAIADGKVNVMPEVLVVGGGGGAFEALASVITQATRSGNLPGIGKGQPTATAAPAPGDNGSRTLKTSGGKSVEVDAG